MAFEKQDSPLWSYLDELANAQGLRLYDVEHLNARHVCVFVDRKEQADSQSIASPLTAEGGNAGGEAAPHASPVRKGITSEECSAFCRTLATCLSAEGEDHGVHPDAQVEVSSPGINRRLRLPQHFEWARGERIKVVLHTAEVPGASKERSSGGTRGPVVIGVLSDLSGETVTVTEEKTSNVVTVPLSSIKSAHVDFKF